MDCVSCGFRAGYNRIVVELVHDVQVGGLCRNCELDEFGNTLSKFIHEDDSCMLCHRDGHYAIPAWKPYEKTTSNRRITCAVEFTIHDRTPLLCDEHYHEICLDSNEPTPSQRSHHR